MSELFFQLMSLTFQGEKEALLEKLRKAADASEQEAEKMEKFIKQLSDKVKRIEGDRDRELADHGNVLAEMQARYAKEKVAAENAHKQVGQLEFYTIIFDEVQILVKKTAFSLSRIAFYRWLNCTPN